MFLDVFGFPESESEVSFPKKVCRSQDIKFVVFVCLRLYRYEIGCNGLQPRATPLAMLVLPLAHACTHLHKSKKVKLKDTDVVSGASSMVARLT